MKRVLILVVFLVFCTFSTVVAQDNSEWLADKDRLQTLADDENKCDRQWQILWKWAKKGNLEARFQIFSLMAPSPDMRPMLMPGNSGDFVTNMRDYTIMAVYSHDYDGDFPLKDEYRNAAYEIYRLVGFDTYKTGGAIKFMECVGSDSHKQCSKIAVDKKLVPSFSDYAEQIDALMAQGMKSTCADSYKAIRQ